MLLAFSDGSAGLCTKWAWDDLVTQVPKGVLKGAVSCCLTAGTGAVALCDGTLHIWNAVSESGELVAQAELQKIDLGKGVTVSCMALHPSGCMLIVGIGNEVQAFWRSSVDASFGAEPIGTMTCDADVCQVACHGDGGLACVTLANGSVRMCTLSDGLAVDESWVLGVNNKDEGMEGVVPVVSMHPEGGFVALGYGATVEVWRLDRSPDEALVKRLDIPEWTGIKSLGFDSSGKALTVLSVDGRILYVMEWPLVL